MNTLLRYSLMLLSRCVRSKDLFLMIDQENSVSQPPVHKRMLEKKNSSNKMFLSKLTVSRYFEKFCQELCKCLINHYKFICGLQEPGIVNYRGKSGFFSFKEMLPAILRQIFWCNLALCAEILLCSQLSRGYS